MQVMMRLRFPLTAASAALRAPLLPSHPRIELRKPQYAITQPTSLVRVSIKCFMTADVYAAIRFQDNEKLKSILTQNSRLENTYDGSGRTPLSAAIYAGNKEAISLLLEKCPNVGEPNFDRSYPIHVASMVGDVEMVKFLHKRFPDTVKAPDRHGRNPLHLAARAGQIQVVKYLVTISNADKLLKAQDENNFTPLGLADKGGKKEVVEILKRKMGH